MTDDRVPLSIVLGMLPMRMPKPIGPAFGMNAPDLRPTDADGAASTGETAPSQQIEHLYLPNFRALYRWIEENRPDLHELILKLPMLDCLKILNTETGLSISGADYIEDSAPLILTALQSKVHPAIAAMVPLDNDGNPLESAP